jgi:hypothetical protein
MCDVTCFLAPFESEAVSETIVNHSSHCEQSAHGPRRLAEHSIAHSTPGWNDATTGCDAGDGSFARCWRVVLALPHGIQERPTRCG